MRWLVKSGDILDEPAEVLICSANPFLTLSGGVGGALLLRYGQHLQRELEAHLSAADKRYVDQGTVIVMRPDGTPYRAVIHAVAVNGMYESSPKMIEQVVAKSLEHAAEFNARRVALTALATGYGKLSPAEFGAGVAPLRPRSFGSLEEVAIVVRKHDEVGEIRSALAL